MTFQHLSVPAVLESLEVIGQYILTVASQAGLDETATYNLRLAVDEIATNIIEHGYAEAGLEGNIELSAGLRDRDLVVTIEDTAPPYDPHQTPPPNLSLPLEHRPVGGLGVHLATVGVDQFLYERVGNRNRNIFVIARGAPETSSATPK